MRMFIIHALATMRRGALLFLATFATFSMKKPSSLFAVPFAVFLLPFQSDCVPCSCGHVCRPFALKRLQRSFQTVSQLFKRLFPFVRTFDHLKRFVRLHSLVLPYFAVLCGVWGGETP